MVEAAVGFVAGLVVGLRWPLELRGPPCCLGSSSPVLVEPPQLFAETEGSVVHGSLHSAAGDRARSVMLGRNNESLS